MGIAGSLLYFSTTAYSFSQFHKVFRYCNSPLLRRFISYAQNVHSKCHGISCIDIILPQRSTFPHVCALVYPHCTALKASSRLKQHSGIVTKALMSGLAIFMMATGWYMSTIIKSLNKGGDVRVPWSLVDLGARPTNLLWNHERTGDSTNIFLGTSTLLKQPHMGQRIITESIEIAVS